MEELPLVVIGNVKSAQLAITQIRQLLERGDLLNAYKILEECLLGLEYAKRGLEIELQDTAP